ncbi:gamma-glutamylcyclotransferase [Thermodesulfobacteriota bacterium B35]
MNPNEPSKENTTGILRLFVYGTLKRGYWNHDRFCRGVLDVQEAVVRGRLYEMSSGIPVLQVPETDILAHGTADPLADVATQARPAGHLASYLEPMPVSATAGDWGPVYGELLTFDDPSIRLPSIDRLEGFHPGRFKSLQTGLGFGLRRERAHPSLVLRGRGSLHRGFQKAIRLRLALRP